MRVCVYGNVCKYAFVFSSMDVSVCMFVCMVARLLIMCKRSVKDLSYSFVYGFNASTPWRYEVAWFSIDIILFYFSFISILNINLNK